MTTLLLNELRRLISVNLGVTMLHSTCGAFDNNYFDNVTFAPKAMLDLREVARNPSQFGVVSGHFPEVWW